MPGTFIWKNFQLLESSILIAAMSSDKEFHHLTKHTGEHVDNKLNQLERHQNDRNSRKDEEENEDSRHNQKQGLRHPEKRIKNYIDHVNHPSE